MRLTAVSNDTVKQNRANKNNNNKINNNMHFKGFADCAVVMWNVIDKGGRALQFTIEDMLGTNFPRTYKGAMSGYKYTGKVNIPSLLQEGIREFLTGPIMSVSPFVILAIATALGGKSANTHVKNIENLSYLMQNMENISDANDFKGSYFKKIITDMLEKTLDTKEVQDDDIKELFDGIKKYDNIISTATKETKKQSKQEAKEVLQNLQASFENIIKRSRSTFDGTDFQTAIFSLSEDKTATTNFENYVQYASAFANDYIKQNKTEKGINLAQETIQAFKKNWIGKRVLTIISMIALTGVIMSIIPKLYTLASGKKNPDTKVFTDVAKEREVK